MGRSLPGLCSHIGRIPANPLLRESRVHRQQENREGEEPPGQSGVLCILNLHGAPFCPQLCSSKSMAMICIK